MKRLFDSHALDARSFVPFSLYHYNLILIHTKPIGIDTQVPENFWRSNGFLLDLGSYKEEQVKLIHHMLYFVVTCCFKASTLNSTSTFSSA
jgi:hypothetical protein